MTTLDAAPSSLHDVSGERESPKLFWSGLALYVISFCLPAVRWVTGRMPGWSCAWLSLFVWANKSVPGSPAKHNLGVRLTVFGGLINLLAITYFLLTIFGQTPRTQRATAWAILGCMPPMWASLYLIGAIPSVGHVVWIGGFLNCLSDDFFGNPETVNRRCVDQMIPLSKAA